MIDFENSTDDGYYDWRQHERELNPTPAPAPDPEPAPVALSPAPDFYDAVAPPPLIHARPPDRETGEPGPGYPDPRGGPNNPAPPPAGNARAEYERAARTFLENTSKKHGASVEQHDLDRMMEHYDSAQRGLTTQAQIKAFNDALDAKYKSRGSNVPGRPAGSGAGSGGSSGGSSGGGTSSSSSSGSAPQFAGDRRGGGFDDPASALLETYALDQFGRRINPDPNSGTALFEKYARELIDTLKQPVYSPQDESIIKGKAIDAIEQERSATKQRWLEELSARRIPPSSGIALDGLQRIENHFNGLRTTVERDFAADAIDQTRRQRFEVLDTAGRLSDAEEGRLREAGTYARIPFDLQDRAFQRNLQLVGAAGSPADLFGSGMSLANFGQQNANMRANYNLSREQMALNADALRSGNRSAMTAALLQYLGYLFA